MCLRPIGLPWAKIDINGTTIMSGIMTETTYLTHLTDASVPLVLSIELKHKQYSLDHETAIVVDRLDVDSISIVPEMTHRFCYENDHSFTSPTSYLGFNGIWKLDTGDCFYRWWHRCSGQGWLLEPTPGFLD